MDIPFISSNNQGSKTSPTMSNASPAPATSNFGNIGVGSSSALSARILHGDHDWIQRVLVGVVVVLTVVALSFFTYKIYLDRRLENKKAELEIYKNQAKQLELQSMKSLSTRLKFVNTLVKEYPYTSSLFSLIERTTENKITYTSLDLRRDPQTGTYTLGLSGQAADYKAIAAQIDVLKQTPYSAYFNSIKVESVKPDQKGYVEFTFKMKVNVAGLDMDTLNQALALADMAGSATTSDVMPVSAVAATSTATSTAPNSFGSKSQKTTQ